MQVPVYKHTDILRKFQIVLWGSITKIFQQCEKHHFFFLFALVANINFPTISLPILEKKIKKKFLETFIFLSSLIYKFIF